MIFFKVIFRIIFRLLLLALVAVFFLWLLFNWPVKKSDQKALLGITFSHLYAQDLGLDWKKAYVKILDELGIERLRLPAYWSEIEKQPGKYDFSDLDWQIQQAEKRNIDVILAFGIKVPRWPECFVPEFYHQDKTVRETALLEYEKVLLERYKGSSAIEIWQVENEPFLPFGDCPAGFVDEEIMDREIAQTKKIDQQRDILTTDSGEMGLWYRAAGKGDLFGTTLYKTIYQKKVGYFEYPIGPNFFRVKKWLVEKFTGQKNFMICELQGEPWGPAWVGEMSLEEQYKTMNAEKLEEMVVFAEKTNISPIYLWGAEWWYWLKEEKGEGAVWAAAKNLFQNDVVEKP